MYIEFKSIVIANTRCMVRNMFAFFTIYDSILWFSITGFTTKNIQMLIIAWKSVLLYSEPIDIHTGKRILKCDVRSGLDLDDSNGPMNFDDWWEKFGKSDVTLNNWWHNRRLNESQKDYFEEYYSRFGNGGSQSEKQLFLSKVVYHIYHLKSSKLGYVTGIRTAGKFPKGLFQRKKPVFSFYLSKTRFHAIMSLWIFFEFMSIF